MAALGISKLLLQKANLLSVFQISTEVLKVEDLKIDLA